MATRSSVTLKPRKQPRQRRSQITMDAVFTATIQVLLSAGAKRLTTTRVAERAGVSVGTLYQYYPNKHALLYAVLQRHLALIAERIEAAARSTHHAPLAAMVGVLVEAFVRAKTERMEETRALYAVASQLEAAALVKEMGARNSAAISAMLATAPDARFDDLALTSYMVWAAMGGSTSTILKDGAPPRMLRTLRAQLRSLCLGYLQREASPR